MLRNLVGALVGCALFGVALTGCSSVSDTTARIGALAARLDAIIPGGAQPVQPADPAAAARAGWIGSPGADAAGSTLYPQAPNSPQGPYGSDSLTGPVPVAGAAPQTQYPQPALSPSPPLAGGTVSADQPSMPQPASRAAPQSGLREPRLGEPGIFDYGLATGRVEDARHRVDPSYGPQPMQGDTQPDTVLRPDLENLLYLDLPGGRVVIKMRPDLAPRHVERVTQLTREGFYDNAPFWRVIDGFMAQTGDPTGTGFGGSGIRLEAEFSDVNHLRGTVSMARGEDPDSADSQFFIVFDEAPWLDNQYTVWGEVLDGMEYIDALSRGGADDKGVVEDPDRIVRMSVAADLAEN